MSLSTRASLSQKSYTHNARFLVVLDADSTLIRNESIELLAAEAGSLETVSEITTRAMRGELDFTQSLSERVATLKGLSDSAFKTAKSQIHVTDGVVELITAVHDSGGAVGVVSGGFHELLDDLCAQLHLDYWRANRLESVDGVLTGRLSGAIIDADAKAEALVEWALDSDISTGHTVAVGDGANDLVMMAEAALSVAFNAKPKVRDAADVAIESYDLSQVLPLLGLRG